MLCRLLVAMAASMTAMSFGMEGLNMDPPRAKILSQGTIYKEEGRYVGWPTVGKAANGDLLVVFSGNRQYHVCPFGKLMMIRSADQGKTWGSPEVISDLPLVDDRDGGVVVTDKGTVIASWFTSSAFASDSMAHKLGRYGIKKSDYDAWKPIIEKLDQHAKNKWIGDFVIRSEDNGKTWSEPIRTHGSSPHGPIQLADGRLMHVGKDHYDGRMLGVASYIEREKHKIGIEVSYDNGRNWQVYSTVPIPDSENIGDFHEPHMVEDLNGKLYVFIRHHYRGTGKSLWVSESTDGGKNWSVARESGICGYPAHLLRLKDGRILVSYGYRASPYEERAVVIDKNGQWNANDFITLAAGHNYNLGYPSSVQLDDGSIYTVYYQEATSQAGSAGGLGGRTELMATHWVLKD